MENTSVPPPTVSSTWVWKDRGKDWPVILSDDETPPKAFMQTRRLGANELPAILLGKRKFIWVVHDDRLQEFDPHHNYLDGVRPFATAELLREDSEETRTEKQRHIAFKQDASAWETLAYWKNFIDSRRAAREAEMDIATKGKRKRKRNVDEDDDDVTVSSVRRSTSGSSAITPPKRQRSSPGGHKMAGGIQLPTRGPTPGKSLLGSFPGLPIPIENGEVHGVSDDEDMFVRPAKTKSDPFISDDGDKLRQLRKQHEQSVINDPPDDDFCTIFVGTAKTPFQVPMSSLDPIGSLSELVKFNDELKAHIDLSGESNVTAREFVPISEYLQHGDFAPRYIDKPGSLPRLDGLVIQEQKDQVAERCAFIFRTASQLQIAGLQSLVVNKLKALYPLSLLVILIVTRVGQDSEKWDCEAEGELFAWLVDHIAEYFFKLTAEHGKRLTEILGNIRDLQRAVMQKVAADPAACRRGMDDDDE